MKKKYLFGIFVFTLICLVLETETMAVPPGPFDDGVFDSHIKTVLLHRQGWEFSYPILSLNDSSALAFSFDNLDTKSKNYNYSVVFCDATWMPSRLTFVEYMDGYFQNPMNTYEPSFSTHIPYIHYSLQIPNENIKLKLSGNYVLIVYENGNDDQPVIVKRFVVLDDKVQIAEEVIRPIQPAYRDKYQQINFSIHHPNYLIDNPYQTIKVSIIKNGNWKLSVNDIQPFYVRESEVVYENPDKNLFVGGNEYRSLDLKSLKYQSANIRSIDFVDGAYQVILKPDMSRDNAGYSYDEDLNGKYLIKNQQGRTPETDAEYVRVFFSFKTDVLPEDGNIYVYGGLSDFNCLDRSKMKYNQENGL